MEEVCWLFGNERLSRHISEAIGLTVSAIDSERMVLRITKGKVQKDRYFRLRFLWNATDRSARGTVKLKTPLRPIDADVGSVLQCMPPPPGGAS